MSKLEEYIPYAKTDRQLEILQTVISEGSNRKAAKKLGVALGTVSNTMIKIKAYAASKGVSPDHGLNKPAPEGFLVSTLRVDKDGNYIPAFAKASSKDQISEMFDYIREEVKSLKKAKITKPAKDTEKDLLNLYTFADVHLGLLSWASETGTDWDLNIGYELVKQSFNDMILRSPKSSECMISLLGDFLHTDGLIPVTPMSGNILDTDTRYPKLVAKSYKLILELINMALQHHDKVIVLCAEGNHDQSSATWIQAVLPPHYEDEPRVEILTHPAPYYAYEWGTNMLCFHHGHKLHKPNDLRQKFSSDPQFRPVWGRTKYCYIHTGHRHYECTSENGAKVIQHPTICGRSAYEVRAGYMSERACMAYTYHKDYGEHSYVVVRPEMFEE